MEKTSIGTQVKNARKERGLTQAELAEKCNFDIRTIQRIEGDEVVPRLYTLRILGTVLGINFTPQTDKNLIDEEVKIYRRMFERRKKFRIATFSITIFLLIAVFLLAFPSWVLFGMPKRVWAPYFYILIFADILGIILTWRCPGCNSLLGEAFSTKYCSKCGLKFMD